MCMCPPPPPPSCMSTVAAAAREQLFGSHLLEGPYVRCTAAVTRSSPFFSIVVLSSSSCQCRLRIIFILRTTCRISVSPVIRSFFRSFLRFLNVNFVFFFVYRHVTSRHVTAYHTHPVGLSVGRSVVYIYTRPNSTSVRRLRRTLLQVPLQVEPSTTDGG